MTYTVTNIKQLTSSKGTNYQRATLTDMNGQTFDDVASFGNDFKTEGMSLDGFLESNEFKGKVGYVFKATQSVKGGGKSAQIERVMDKKQDAILFSQDRKNDAIQHAGAITNATNLTIAEGNAGLLEGKDYQTRLRENIIFYQNLYKYPENINPSSLDKPPF